MADNKKRVEGVLGVFLTDDTYIDMKSDWRAFTDNPEEYKDSFAVACVLHWLNCRSQQ